MVAPMVMMSKNRLEAFSDGVIAIIITIMVLELKVPHGEDLKTITPLLPIFLSYVLSFIYVAIYWNNHHHMMHTCQSISSSILWANMHLLFWLSLIPFGTGLMGENHFSGIPTAIYGFILLMSGVAYWVLQQQIIRYQGADSILRKAIGKDFKGKTSPLIYLIALLCACAYPSLAIFLYVFVALMWLVPDRRIEKILLQGD